MRTGRACDNSRLENKPAFCPAKIVRAAPKVDIKALCPGNLLNSEKMKNDPTSFVQMLAPEIKLHPWQELVIRKMEELHADQDLFEKMYLNSFEPRTTKRRVMHGISQFQTGAPKGFVAFQDAHVVKWQEMKDREYAKQIVDWDCKIHPVHGYD